MEGLFGVSREGGPWGCHVSVPLGPMFRMCVLWTAWHGDCRRLWCSLSVF